MKVAGKKYSSFTYKQFKETIKDLTLNEKNAPKEVVIWVDSETDVEAYEKNLQAMIDSGDMMKFIEER